MAAETEIHTFLCRSDNIGVLIRDPATGACAAIDVPEAGPVLKALDETGWRLTDILVTHRHADHVEGIPAVKQATGARVVAPAKAGDAVPAGGHHRSRGRHGAGRRTWRPRSGRRRAIASTTSPIGSPRPAWSAPATRCSPWAAAG